MKDADFVDLGVLPCSLDGGVAARAAIGLVVLGIDQTMELEFRRLMPLDGVGLYASRVFCDNEITPETLRAIGPRIAPGTELIMPGQHLDVVAFGCTSATMTLGEEAVFAEIHKVRPGIACTTPVTAALAAFKALGARRIGVLTPYEPAVNEIVRRYLDSRGVHVAAFGTWNKVQDPEAARISLDSVEDGVARLAEAAQLDAVFVSCTSIRLSERVEAIEARAGLPVTSSDHAMAWHCLRLAGVNDAVPGAGRLFGVTLEGTAAG
ncbi:maleate cis-trans isomerase family protein [Seohaeicola zhoushanensis]|uniref:Asp/Glu racemase n=1 Tax=Seohaeicola zhoushanensis TaxID=1569283 RepID=A0A8J3M8F6_9RHOB|nr:aspartate/glutamate racemase family protein [Seohaeicola zhoushanensis]GHF42019.1 Asp/Glu racemase [Seohaeicola zhoushanensis]